MNRLWVLVAAALAGFGCASAPVAPVSPAAPIRPVVSLDQKVAWILRLEHERQLRDASVSELLSGDPSVSRAFEPASAPHLGALLRDPDASVRRRAALAIGRTRVPDGARWLTAALADPVPDVRASAAFALGLSAQPSTVPALQGALADPDVTVRGRAAEALGLIGAPAAAAAPAVAGAFSTCAASLASVPPDDESITDVAVSACRLALVSLARLRNFDALARVALHADGRPVTEWWPVAFALQRIGDKRAADGLAALAASSGAYSQAFALRGLAGLRDPRAPALALEVLTRTSADVKLKAAALGAIRTMASADRASVRDASETVGRLALDPATPGPLALDALAVLGAIGDAGVFGSLTDLFTDPRPPFRLAAMRAAAAVDREGFLVLLSSLPADPDPTVRAGLARLLAAWPRDLALPALTAMADDQDPRVLAPVLDALAGFDAPDLAARLAAALDAADFVVRATAARLAGEKKVPGALPRLVGAYDRGVSDAAPDARLAAIDGLARFGGDDALVVLRKALSDPSWPIRVRAATLLREAGHFGVEPQRPAPLREPASVFESDAVLRPPYSPHAFIETARGVIEIELNVVDAPMASRSFIELARAGFFNGLRVHRLVPGFVIQTGDPRGDGAGGPGYTIKDEFSTVPFVRGTVGMASSGPETAGSQFFITLSPQPHLDGLYTVFGRVVAGTEWLDLIEAGDVVTRVRIWDGVTLR